MKKNFLLFSPFSSLDPDEKISSPHLGDLSLKLFIIFLESSLMEKSLLGLFLFSLGSLPLPVPFPVPVVEVGRTKVNRFVRISSLES